jgi:hypothetical protein
MPPAMFLDIPTAAEKAGYSLKHFRRFIEEDGIPTQKFGRKLFILGRDFQKWADARKPKATHAK